MFNGVTVTGICQLSGTDHLEKYKACNFFLYMRYISSTLFNSKFDCTHSYLGDGLSLI